MSDTFALNPQRRTQRIKPIRGHSAEIIIVKDYFQNPDFVRETALSADFNVRYPGDDHGIGCIAFTERPKHIEADIRSLSKISDGTFCSRFQLTPSKLEKHWRIHRDTSPISAFVYLTPGHDGIPGTEFYRHQATQMFMGDELHIRATGLALGVPGKYVFEQLEQDSRIKSKWDQIAVVPYEFNTLVMFPGALYHTNASFFGDTVSNSRMVQALYIDK